MKKREIESDYYIWLYQILFDSMKNKSHYFGSNARKVKICGQEGRGCMESKRESVISVVRCHRRHSLGLEINSIVFLFINFLGWTRRWWWIAATTWRWWSSSSTLSFMFLYFSIYFQSILFLFSYTWWWGWRVWTWRSTSFSFSNL